MMQRSTDRRSFLIVEGSEDVKALDPHVAESRCLMIIAGGKENALGAMELVVQNEIEHVGALVDGDHICKEIDVRLGLPGVVTTDRNDLDSEVLQIPGLVSRIAFSHIDGRVLRAVLAKNGCADVLGAILRIVAPVTNLRFACQQYGVDLSTKDFPIVSIYSKGKIELSFDQAAAVARGRLGTEDQPVYGPVIESWLTSDEVDDADALIFHNGHHMFSALHALLRHECAYTPKIENLENAVRAAASWPEFSSLDFAKRLSDEFEDMGFWIWREERAPATSVA